MSDKSSEANQILQCRSLKRWLLLSIKLVFAILVFFLAAEVILFFFAETLLRPFFIYDPDLGFRVRPYALWYSETQRSNEFGFNDRDYPHQPAEGTYRILTVSDSFSWAGGPRNYSHIFEEKLKSEFGPDHVEVVNAGYFATHTGEQLGMLRKFGLQYRPHLVVLGFFAGNDFQDAMPWRKRIAVGTSVVDLDMRNETLWEFAGRPVLLRSRLLLLLRRQWTLIRERALRERELKESIPQTGGTDDLEKPPVLISTESFFRVERRRMRFAELSAVERYEVNVRNVLHSLTEMKVLLGAHGVDFVVVAFPDVYQVDFELRERLIEHFNLDADQFAWTRAQDLLKGFCEKEGVEFYDLLPKFREAYSRGLQLYIPNDSHWTAQGNEFAAELIFEFLAYKVADDARRTGE